MWSRQFQRRWHERLARLLRFLKPRAEYPDLAILLSNPLDSHKRPARFEADNISRLKHLCSPKTTESRHRGSVSQNDITLVAKAESFRDEREPPLRVGDFVQLNSGSQTMMVVDADVEHIVAAWRADNGEAVEAAFPRPCCHRVSRL